MKKNVQLTRVVLCQNLGFLGLMVIVYLDELLKLPSLVFSEHPFAFVHQRSTLDMLLVLAVWFLVSRSTRRMLDRVRYLEEFMRQGFDTPTTHGICAECLQGQQAAIAKAKHPRKAAGTATAS